MTFRSRANPGQRRRRVLLDETLNEDARPAVAPAPSGKRNKRYPDDALTDAQPRITDIVPASWRSVIGICLSLTALDVAIAVLHWFAPEWQEKFPQMPLSVLNATSPTSLAQLALLGQFILVVAGCCAVFAIRRRRLDDLRGTYQVWIWATIAATCGVLLAGTDLPQLLAYAIAQIPGIPASNQPRYYFWLGILGFLLPLKVRLLIEVRRVRAAQVLLIFAILPFAIRETLLLKFIEFPERIATTAVATTTLLGATLLVAALLSYARYVKLDALGAFNKKKGKKRKKKEADIEEGGEREPVVKSRHRVDSGSSEVPRPNSIGAAISSARSKEPDEDEDRPSGPLSKANRKSLRR
jgi:hypothetical protein